MAAILDEIINLTAPDFDEYHKALGRIAIKAIEAKATIEWEIDRMVETMAQRWEEAQDAQADAMSANWGHD